MIKKEAEEALRIEATEMTNMKYPEYMKIYIDNFMNSKKYQQILLYTEKSLATQWCQLQE